MTKRARVEALAKEGRKTKWISEMIGCSYGSVRTILWRFRHPEKSRVLRKKSREKNRIAHQMATRPRATNHRETWTLQDLDYLRAHGKICPARELAVKLGRTHSAIRYAARVYGIDLRDDSKMGVNSNRFRASCGNAAQSQVQNP